MIYLDNNATTRPLDSVIEAMSECMRNRYANASASTAVFTGADIPRRDAANAMCALLKAEDPDCFAFTSGATESNNWVFGPVARGCSGRTVIISAIEHPSITKPAIALRHEGFTVIEIPVDPNGRISMTALAEALSGDVAIASIASANNETGVIQDIEAVGRLVRENAPATIFHVDATQSVGKVAIDLGNQFSDVDMLSFSAHKFHGPKGIGGLYVRPGIVVPPFIVGGGQEDGRRSGTANSPALIGLATAAREVSSGSKHIEALRGVFETALLRAFPAAIIFSAKADRLPNTTCFAIPNLRGEAVVEDLAQHGIIVSSGSACSSGTLAPPKTVLAMGIPYDVASGAIRVSASRFNSQGDFEQLMSKLGGCLAGLLSE